MTLRSTSAHPGVGPGIPILLGLLVVSGGLAGCTARDGAVAADTAASALADASAATLASLTTGGFAGASVGGSLDLATATSARAVPTTTAVPDVVDSVAPAAVIDGGPRGLSSGSKGAPVSALEERLTALRFNPGKADGSYDGQLAMAVMAFQKQQSLPRSGRADPATLGRLATTPLGTSMVATGEATRVEIDLKRQIAQFWKGGRLLRVLAVSTGNGARYCVPKDKGGGCDTAITPGGSYRADRKIKGVRVSALGSLYDPVYFFGGIAIHGSPSIPAVPASHGCVRVAMWESAWVHNTVNIGDPVYVVGGKIAPVPFGETAPVEAPDEITVPSADA